MITLKEIREQPEKLKLISENYRSLTDSSKSFINRNGFKKIAFVGCGTSYYLSMGLAYQLERLSCGKTETCFYSGSEIMFNLRKPDSKTLIVGVSRSGESSETVRALEVSKAAGCKTLAVTCEPNCSMTKVADESIVLDFMKEESIVMTKSFTSMAFVMSALFRDLFDAGNLDDYLFEIPQVAGEILRRTEKLYLETDFSMYDRFALLGYDEYLAACMEGLIKVTEMSLAEADAFQTLEYRHGPKSKVDKRAFVAILPSSLIWREELKVAREMAGMGGYVLNVSNVEFEGCGNIRTLYNGDDYGDWMLRVIPLQLIGVEKALSKSLNPDQPQNLTKVVKL